MQNNIRYYRNHENIEWIFYRNAIQSYPVHTHAGHITLGYVLDGAVRIICGSEELVYQAGRQFFIMPDTPHAIVPVHASTYSMIIACLPVGKVPEKWKHDIPYTTRLKQIILNAPEDKLFIDEMAQTIGVSPYHLIRQFRSDCGLTPHQFQIQCRVRKAQKLLAEGKSATEAAYAAGFCDQSHLDRCFRKVVCLTPSEYKLSLRVCIPVWHAGEQ